MKDTPSSLLESAVVIVPRSHRRSGAKQIAALGLGLGTLSVGLLFLLTTLLTGGPDKAINSFGAILLVIIFMVVATVLSFIWFDSLERNKELLLGRDVHTGEIFIAQCNAGRPRSVWRHPLRDIEAIQIHWQATYTGSGSAGDPEFGWWMAELILLSQPAIYLDGIRWRRDTPPPNWLARFQRASELLEKPLHVIQFEAITGPIISKPPIVALIHALEGKQPSKNTKRNP